MPSSLTQRVSYTVISQNYSAALKPFPKKSQFQSQTSKPLEISGPAIGRRSLRSATLSDSKSPLVTNPRLLLRIVKVMGNEVAKQPLKKHRAVKRKFPETSNGVLQTPVDGGSAEYLPLAYRTRSGCSHTKPDTRSSSTENVDTEPLITKKSLRQWHVGLQHNRQQTFPTGRDPRKPKNHVSKKRIANSTCKHTARKLLGSMVSAGSNSSDVQEPPNCTKHYKQSTSVVPSLFEGKSNDDPPNVTRDSLRPLACRSVTATHLPCPKSSYNCSPQSTQGQCPSNLRPEVLVVETPTFRLRHLSPEKSKSVKQCTNSHRRPPVEDTGEEALLRRHEKYEAEERRRKRWALQELRERLYCKKLAKRAEEAQRRQLAGCLSSDKGNATPAQDETTEERRSSDIIYVDVVQTLPKNVVTFLIAAQD